MSNIVLKNINDDSIFFGSILEELSKNHYISAKSKKYVSKSFICWKFAASKDFYMTYGYQDYKLLGLIEIQSPTPLSLFSPNKTMEQEAFYEKAKQELLDEVFDFKNKNRKLFIPKMLTTGVYFYIFEQMSESMTFVFQEMPGEYWDALAEEAQYMNSETDYVSYNTEEIKQIVEGSEILPEKYKINFSVQRESPLFRVGNPGSPIYELGGNYPIGFIPTPSKYNWRDAVT